MQRRFLAALLLALPLALPWQVTPSRRGIVAHTTAPRRLRAAWPVAQLEDDEDMGEDDEAEPFVDDGSDDVGDALRYLAAERDVENYLRQGKNLLGRKVALMLPSADIALEDTLLLAASKLIKLGASVTVVFDAVGPGRRPDVAKRIPFPRCTAVAANLSCAVELTRSIAGASTLVVGAAMPSARVEALETALCALAERPATTTPTKSAGDANADGDELGGDAASELGGDAASAVPSTPGELANRSMPRGVVEQLVLLSSVEVYGEAHTRGNSGGGDGGGDGSSGSGGGGDELTASEASSRPRLHIEESSPQPSDPSAVALLAIEQRLAACCERTAVLRACTLVGEDGTPPLETLLSDALGLQDLLVEYLAELRSKTGLADAPTAASRAAAAATDAFTALMPPGGQLVQLTHVEELAGAAVFAALADGLEGQYHVCAQPETLQALFDGLSAHREWEQMRLRDTVLPVEVDEHPRFYSTARLEDAGYQLLWPKVANAANEGAAVDVDAASDLRFAESSTIDTVEVQDSEDGDEGEGGEESGEGSFRPPS